MVAKRKGPTKCKSKIVPGSAKKTVARNVVPSSGPACVSAKTTDILSVLENSKAAHGIAVGHLVEAFPVSVDAVDELTWFLGEVVANKWIDAIPFFYIHFLGEDSKMDDWVPLSQVRQIASTDIEQRLGVTGLNSPFFALSAFSASASAVYPRHTIKSVRGVQLGNSVVLRAWYPSPYPEMITCPNAYIKVCDTCLSYFKSADELSRHWNYCAFSHPPGIEIYRDGDISVFEIDGEAFNGYSERLLLLAKLFLEEKRACSQDASQYAQVRTFHFYVVCRWNGDSGRAEIVGYFSKLKNEKRESHILSCILVLPHEQRKGFGKFLIDLSYKLAEIEGRIGSAERPLSQLGQLSFFPYWMRKIASFLRDAERQSVSIAEIANASGIICDDIVETLRHYGLIKEWGTAGVVVIAGYEAVDSICPPSKSSQKSQFNPELLHWIPSYRLVPSVYLTRSVWYRRNPWSSSEVVLHFHPLYIRTYRLPLQTVIAPGHFRFSIRVKPETVLKSKCSFDIWPTSSAGPSSPPCKQLDSALRQLPSLFASNLFIDNSGFMIDGVRYSPSGAISVSEAISRSTSSILVQSSLTWMHAELKSVVA